MTNEKRLIEANALTDAIEATDWYHISPKGYLEKGANSQIHRPLFKADDIFQVLKDAPTVDAVEVVRCWECKYGDMCSIREAMAASDWNAYCYRGERKFND